MNFLANLYKALGLLCRFLLVLLRYIAILLWIAMSAKGICQIIDILFIHAISDDDLMEHLLHTVEILFIAPIPVMVIESYRGLIFTILPSTKSPPVPAVNDPLSIKPEDAEMAFIGSLIGVTSTYIFSVILNFLKTHNGAEHEIPYRTITFLVFAFLFLGVQFFYLNRLKKH